MNITEVRIKLISNPSDRLKAFASVTFDGDFVVRDIKVIDGTTGVFVAMPSRKLADRCPKCGSKNHLRAKYCNECGGQLPQERSADDRRGRNKLHADIAHPINTECRQLLQQAIVEAYHEEVEQSKQPGYRPAAEDDFEEAKADQEFGGGLDEASKKPRERDRSRDQIRMQDHEAQVADEVDEVIEDEEEAEVEVEVEGDDFARVQAVSEDQEESDDEGSLVDFDDQGDSDEASRSDYDSLIDDLKRDARQRRGPRHDRRDERRDRSAPPARAKEEPEKPKPVEPAPPSHSPEPLQDERDAVTASTADTSEDAADDSGQDEFGAGII